MPQPRSEAGGAGLFILNLAAFLLNAVFAAVNICVGNYSLLLVNIPCALLSLGVAFWAVTI